MPLLLERPMHKRGSQVCAASVRHQLNNLILPTGVQPFNCCLLSLHSLHPPTQHSRYAMPTLERRCEGTCPASVEYAGVRLGHQTTTHTTPTHLISVMVKLEHLDRSHDVGIVVQDQLLQPPACCEVDPVEVGETCSRLQRQRVAVTQPRVRGAITRRSLWRGGYSRALAPCYGHTNTDTQTDTQTHKG